MNATVTTPSIKIQKYPFHDFSNLIIQNQIRIYRRNYYHWFFVSHCDSSKLPLLKPLYEYTLFSSLLLQLPLISYLIYSLLFQPPIISYTLFSCNRFSSHISYTHFSFNHLSSHILSSLVTASYLIYSLLFSCNRLSSHLLCTCICCSQHWFWFGRSPDRNRSCLR